VQIQPKGFLSEPAAMNTIELPQNTARLSLASEILREFGALRLGVYGSSMVPAIFPGDVATVHRVAPGDVQRGDVILYFRGNRFFAHRVVHKAGAPGRMAWITRGDALSENDPPVSESELLGTVTAILRGKNQIVLPRPRSFTGRLAAWCVQRFDIVLALFLLWHVFRRRLAAGGTSPAIAMQNPEGSW